MKKRPGLAHFLKNNNRLQHKETHEVVSLNPGNRIWVDKSSRLFDVNVLLCLKRQKIECKRGLD